MPTPKIEKYYPDTNFLWGIKPDEVILLLDKCHKHKIQISISEVVIWEYSRKLFQAATEKTRTPTIGLIPDPNKGDSLLRHFATNKKLFESCEANVLPLKIEHKTLAKELTDAGCFNGSNPNDARDALILATAITEFDTTDIQIICSDGNLKNQFQKQNFKLLQDVELFRAGLRDTQKSPNVQNPDPEEINNMNRDEILSKEFLKVLPEIEPKYGVYVLKFLEQKPPPQTREVQSNFANLFPWLDSGEQQDREIKVRALGYAWLGDPAPESEIFGFLKQDGFPDEAVLRNISYIIHEGILNKIGNFLVPNKENPEAMKICEEAGYSILEELMQKVDGE